LYDKKIFPKIVFISACKSQEFGEMFLSFSDHVICSKSNLPLDDATA